MSTGRIAMEIRLAREADAGSIARLSRTFIEDGLPWTWTPDRVLRAMRKRETEAVVAWENGRLAGFGILELGDEDAHLLLLGVDPGRQRLGVGRALVTWLEEVARTAQLSAVHLEVRATRFGAHAFYRQLGYNVRGLKPRYYSGLEDALIMTHPFVDPAAKP